MLYVGNNLNSLERIWLLLLLWIYSEYKLFKVYLRSEKSDMDVIYRDVKFCQLKHSLYGGQNILQACQIIYKQWLFCGRLKNRKSWQLVVKRVINVCSKRCNVCREDAFLITTVMGTFCPTVGQGAEMPSLSPSVININEQRTVAVCFEAWDQDDTSFETCSDSSLFTVLGSDFHCSPD